MPLYDFKCKDCEEVQEKRQKYEDAPPKCKKCGGETKRQVSAGSFHLKGTGWYKTDYQNK